MFPYSSKILVFCAAGMLSLTRADGAGPSFKPDATLHGSALTNWRTLGPAEWKAVNGELTGAPKTPAGGWLVLDRPMQDVGFYASFRCAPGCKTGVLLRGEKTPAGMKGVFLSLDEGDVASYRVTLNAQGEIMERERLRYAGGQVRVAPPPDPNAAGRGAGGRGLPGGGRGPGGGRAGIPGAVAPPIAPPTPGLQPGAWNRVEVLLDANTIRAFLNDAGETAGGAADEEVGRSGALALYAGGTGEVRFKEVSYKDLGVRQMPAEEVSTRFRMQRLNDQFYGWAQATADFNNDGAPDIVAGPYLYFGPDFTRYREMAVARALGPSREYPQDWWVELAGDFTGDGWADVLTTSHSNGAGAWLYVNPKGESRRWDRYQVITAISTEITLLRDLDGDGKPEVVYAGEGFMRYAKPDPAKPTGPWSIHSISERGAWPAHGLGVGDINSDGRQDVVSAYGWWEQPPPATEQESWTYHPEAFGRWSRSGPGGSVMAVYDVNGDGRNDVVTSLQAHGFGLSWFEQKREGGRISFVEHPVMGTPADQNAGGVVFSQLHGSGFADVDGDGITDFLVGKRYWSHLDDYFDPDPYGPPVLYWYRTVRNPKAPGGAELVPQLIHNRSGVGSDVLAADLNRDGAVDVVTSTNRGTFVFWGKRAAKPAAK